MSVVNILVVFHVVFAALWFGAPLMLGSVLKKAKPHGRAAFHAATTVGARMAMLAGVGVIGVVVTGVGLIFLKYGGMKGLPVRFHIALGLGLLATGVGFGLLRPTVSKLAQAASAESYDLEQATASIKRVAMGVGINHLLWLICLVLMFAY